MTSNCSNPDYNAKYQTKEYKKKEREFQPINNNSDVVHIYYDIIMTNNNTGFDSTGTAIPTVKAVPCLFNQNRQMPYLNNPSEYDVTVPFFHLDSNSFPLQIVQPVTPGIYQPLKTINGYTVGGFLTVYGGSITIPSGDNIDFNVLWHPEDKTLIRPPDPVTLADLGNEYFYNYSYNHFLDLLNNIIAFIITLKMPTSGIPYFSYNPNNKKFYFNAPSNWNNTSSNIIYLNDQLYNLLASLPSTYSPILGYKLTVLADPGLTNIITQYNALTFPLTGSINYIVMEQTYSSTQLWNPVVSVVFKARNLNVINTQDALPLIYGLNPNTETNNANVSNVLFEYGIGKRIDPVLNYQPLSEYILTNLLGITEVTELQLDVFWKDDFGNLHTFYLEPGSSLIMKLLFRKKGFSY